MFLRKVCHSSPKGRSMPSVYRPPIRWGLTRYGSCTHSRMTRRELSMRCFPTTLTRGNETSTAREFELSHPDDGSPLKEEQFAPKTEVYCYSDFKKWLEQR